VKSGKISSIKFEDFLGDKYLTMATKRSTGESAVTSGAASARVKSTSTRKHRNSAVTERSETAAAPSSSPVAETFRTTPTFDDVAQLAYSYWEARGYQGGSPEEDWLRAEQQLIPSLTSSVAN
jgi:hypothetical protein